MATSLKLVWKYIDSTDLDTLDLLNATDGFNLNQGGWSPQTIEDDATSVIDVFNLRASASSNNALASVVQDLDQFKKRVGWTREPTETRGVFLRTQMGSESSEREAYVYDLNYQINNPIYDVFQTRASRFENIDLAIEHGAWESPSAVASASTLTITGNIGGSVLWGDSINGDLPARLAEFSATASAAGAGGPGQMWVGFKTSRYGTTASNFVPYWPAASAGYLGADTAASNDGYGRSTLVCDFATTASMATRMTLRPSDFIPLSASDQRGSYLVLMAAMADFSPATVVRARIVYANSYTGLTLNPVYRPRVTVDGSLIYWQTIEMGNVTLPANYMVSSDSLSNWALRLEVERVSGTGKFWVYGFYFVPLEGLLTVTGTLTLLRTATAFAKPDGQLVAHSYSTGSFQDDLVATGTNWGLPANDEKPYLIGVLDGGYGYATNTWITATYKFVKRWRTLRGSE